VACPEIAVVHLGTPQNLLAFYRKQRWHGKHVLLVFLSDISALANFKAVAFALYTLICMLTLGVGLILALVSGGITLILFSLAALSFGVLWLSLRHAASARDFGSIPFLIVLYLTYGIARAACLLEIQSWMRPKPADQSVTSGRHKIHQTGG
jgi:hypothetical protein